MDEAGLKMSDHILCTNFWSEKRGVFEKLIFSQVPGDGFSSCSAKCETHNKKLSKCSDKTVFQVFRQYHTFIFLSYIRYSQVSLNRLPHSKIGDMLIGCLWKFFICFFVFWSDCQSHAFWWSGQTLLVLSVCFWPLCHLASCLTSSFLGLFVAHIWVLCFLWFPVFSFIWHQHIFGFLCVFSRFTCFPWGGEFSCYLTNSLSLHWHTVLSTLVLTVHTHIIIAGSHLAYMLWLHAHVAGSHIYKLLHKPQYHLGLAFERLRNVWKCFTKLQPRSSTWESPIVALLCSIIGAADTLVRIWELVSKLVLRSPLVLTFGRFYEDMRLFANSFWAFWKMHLLPALWSRVFHIAVLSLCYLGADM